jgi:DNA-binding MarR family transcriptional regulator
MASRTRPARISPLEAHLGYWLRFVSNHVSHAFSAKLAERGVTVPEWVVLRQLYEAGGIASQLAEELQMTRGAISKLVDRLSAKELVTRNEGEGDRRYQSLELTATGRALVPKLAALADQNDAEFFGHMSDAERARIEGALKELVRRHQLTTIPVD